MKKRILVTGGCGFIGATLVPNLIGRGFDVAILDNLSKGDVGLLDGSNATIMVGDIRNQKDVSHAMRGVDAVVHLAAYGSVVESVENPEENFSNNAYGTFVVLDEARKAGVTKVVFASTGGALIGNAVPPVDENSLPRPISPYGASKLCGEAYCAAFAAAYKMNTVALRFANVVGPNSAHKRGAITTFSKAILSNKPIVIYGDGSATRDFLYVNDLCDGIVRGVEAQLTGFQIFHLSSGREVSIKELARILCEIAGKPEHPIEYRESRVGEVEKNFASYSRAHSLLGFEPHTNLEEALNISLAWFKQENMKNAENVEQIGK